MNLENIEIFEQVEVHLIMDNQRWVVQLTKIPYAKSGIEYAFYLLRDGIRVAHCWYGKQLTVQFENDGVAGHYQARAFIRKIPINGNGNSSIIKTVDSPQVSQEGKPYDLRKWNYLPITELDFTNGWEERSDLKDGVYHFIDGDKTLDIRIFGTENAPTQKEVLVCFNGAITNRKCTSGPFFSGAGIAKQLGVPIISISDPSLNRSHSLNQQFPGNPVHPLEK